MTINVIEEADRIFKTWKEKVLPCDYIENGIMLWEGLAFCAVCDKLGITLVLESGVAGGRSTEILARYFDFDIKAVDDGKLYGMDRFNNTKKRLSKYPNVEMINGDSDILVPDLIHANKDKKIAVLIDGPKGNRAKHLAKICMRDKTVKFVAIHDTCRDYSYHNLDDMIGTFFYTDDPKFLKKYKFIDSGKDIYSEDGGGLGFVRNIKWNDINMSQKIRFISRRGIKKLKQDIILITGYPHNSFSKPLVQIKRFIDISRGKVIRKPK